MKAIEDNRENRKERTKESGNTHTSVSTCLKSTFSSRCQTSPSHTTLHTSPVSPSPSSPNADTSCARILGNGAHNQYYLRVYRGSSIQGDRYFLEQTLTWGWNRWNKHFPLNSGLVENVWLKSYKDLKFEMYWRKKSLLRSGRGMKCGSWYLHKIHFPATP